MAWNWNLFHRISQGISGVIIIFTILLCIIYIRNKKFHDYPCYFNIFVSVVISFDNIFRLIPIEANNQNIGCKIQSYALIFLDKLVLFSITVYTLIQYMGVVKFKVYKKNEKKIFYISLSISIVTSLILAFIFWYDHVVRTNHGHFCYVNTGSKNVFKEYSDSIVSFCLYLINLYCVIQILSFIQNLLNQKDERKKCQFNLHYWRFFVYLYLNSFTFMVALLLINDSLFVQNESKHLTYIIVTFFVHLFYTVNMSSLTGFKDLITCKSNIDNNVNDYDDDMSVRSNINDINDDDSSRCSSIIELDDST